MSARSPAQKRAIAIAIAKRNSLAQVAKKASPKVYKGKGAYVKAAPRGNYASGYGDYNISKGSSVGSQIGAWLGDKAQSLIKSVTGFGDYVKPGWNVKQNSLLTMGQDPPQVKNSREGGVIVRHREYLQDIVTGTPGQFVVSSYKLQPGLQGSFPWLSIIAQNFEQYKLRGVIYEFKSTSADSLNSTNTALGEVIMATEYDSKKPNFANKLEMQNHQYAVAARQSSSMLHPIECAHPISTLDVLYIRQGTPPDGTDSRMYDFGNFQIATVGQQGANVNVGELWVTYEVEFLKPRLQGEGNIIFSAVYGQYGSVCSTADFFGIEAPGSSFREHPNNNLDIKFKTQSFEFPDDIGNGTYLIDIEWLGSSTLISSLPTISHSAGNGVDLSTNVQPWSGGNQGPAAGATTTKLHMSLIAYLGTPTVPGTLRNITFSGGILPASAFCQIAITSILTGFDAAGFVPYVDPAWSTMAVSSFARPRFGRNMRTLLSEKEAVKAEILRLSKLIEEEKGEDEKRVSSSEDTEGTPEEDTPGPEEDIYSKVQLEELIARAILKNKMT